MARSLLGLTLASDLGGARVSGIIVETEAYLGVHDAASHAWRGRRHRLNHGIYAPSGTWYVYRSYGIHWCLNLTTPTDDDGAAVLVRAVVPNAGIEIIQQRRGHVADKHLTNGPGKVGQAFAITGEHDGMPATDDSPLRLLQAAQRRRRGSIAVTPRIGITRAADWPLRFVLRSQKRAG
jgi:DNA-3-methyladenine glycosylase